MAFFGIKQEHSEGVRVDGNLLYPWKTFTCGIGLTGNYSYAVRSFPFGYHEAWHLFPGVRFSVILLMQVDSHATCNIPSETVSHVNGPCVKSFVEPGDRIDNDCDGQIDEEILNGADDDKDNKIDEDLQDSPRVDGNWSEWTLAKCLVTCGNRSGEMGRERACDNPPSSGDGHPCIGPSKEVTGEQCVGSLLTCQEDCNDGTWGYNCIRKCGNCFTTCVKDTGRCVDLKCQKGFFSPWCNIRCEEDCEICGVTGDCIECKKGFWAGETCSNHCPLNLHGTNCSEECPQNCKHQKCEADTGTCKTCRPGKWGLNCTKDCHVRCLHNRCRQHTGECMKHTSMWLSVQPAVFLLCVLTIIYCMMKRNKKHEINKSVVGSIPEELEVEAEDNPDEENNDGSDFDSDDSQGSRKT